MQYVKKAFSKYSRLFISGVIVLIQAYFLYILLKGFTHMTDFVSLVCKLISGGVVIYIVNKDENPAYKIAWIIPILLAPVLGGLMYLIFGNKKPAKKIREKLEEEYMRQKKSIDINNEAIKEVEQKDLSIAGQMKYLSNYMDFPVYKNTETTYYKSGEEMFESMIKELKAAKHYIFMEYFIIEEGEMWNTILDILEQKAKEGLDVRVIYDDVGCISLLVEKYCDVLKAKGIKAIAFNKFVPVMSLAYNNRDHKKITVIDGHTGFTGGVNLADEYINKKKRFGHWKDTAIMLKGDAVWSLTTMFLQMWNAFSTDAVKDDYSLYKPNTHFEKEFLNDGYVQPYQDSPLDEEVVGENVYLNIINNAKKYVYIFTPYLIIDNEMVTAMTLAAKRGVDVKIVTPGIPDKKSVFKVTRSYYRQLINNGVEIYEYSPGFIHAKVVVCDDEVATVGTINFDYRSLYLHFECGVYLYNTKSILDIKQDAIDTIAVSKKIQKESLKSGELYSIYAAILRVFAPLI